MTTKTQKLELLRAVPLLGGLSKGEIQSFLKETQEEFFTPGETIVTEGATGGRFYVILSGRAKVIVNGRTKGSVGPGGFFGEMSLIDSSPRAATVRAETDVAAISIASWNFLTMLEKHWSIAHKVMVELVRRVRSCERSVTH